MKKVSGYNYAAVIPAEEITEGFLRYFITVRENEKATTFPSSKRGSPSDWDFRGEPFETSVVPASSPIFIFNAISDNDKLSRQWNRASSFVPLGPGAAEVRVNIEKLSEVDPENPKAERIHDYSMRYYFGDKIAGRKGSLEEKKNIVVRGRSLTTKTSWVQVALVTNTGFAFGGVVNLEPASKEYSFALSDLKQVKLVTLPRPYPTFLPYFFRGAGTPEMNIHDVETLQISIGPGIPEGELENKHSIAIESVRLE